MNNKISVILPIYNVAPYLAKCLTSIVNNTYKNLEIICVNDGSSDNSLEICRKFAEGGQDTDFIIIDQKNAGVSAARNAGLKAATGDYIVFIDPDDYIHPRCLQILYDGLQANNADIALCPFEKVYDGHEIPKISDDFDVLSTFYAIEFQGYNIKDEDIEKYIKKFKVSKREVAPETSNIKQLKDIKKAPDKKDIPRAKTNINSNTIYDLSFLDKL